MIPPGCSFPSRVGHLKVMNWVGRTIFGSMNGKALDVPETRLRRPRNNASTIRSKDHLLSGHARSRTSRHQPDARRRAWFENRASSQRVVSRAKKSENIAEVLLTIFSAIHHNTLIGAMVMVSDQHSRRTETSSAPLPRASGGVDVRTVKGCSW
jgi:hypothetical protein